MTRDELIRWAEEIEARKDGDENHPDSRAEWLRDTAINIAAYGTTPVEAMWVNRAHSAEARLYFVSAALAACKRRIHFVGLPSEPKLLDGNSPSWKKTIGIIEDAIDFAEAKTPEPVQESHYGAEVWTDRTMDALRRERCLCLRCGHLGTCGRAQKLLALCKDGDLALAVTRCPLWVRKDTETDG